METTSVLATFNAVAISSTKVLNAVLIAVFPARVVLYEVVSLALHAPAFPDAFDVAVLALTGVIAFSVIPPNKVSTTEYRSLYVIVTKSNVISCPQGLETL